MKNTILPSATLRSDVTGCVALFKDFFHQSSTQSDTQSLMIAQVETGKNRNTRCGSKGGKHAVPIKCENRFYSREGYKKLLPGNRVYLRQIMNKRKGDTIRDGESNMRMKATTSQAFEMSLAVLASSVDTLGVTDATSAVPPPGPAADPPFNSTYSVLQSIQTR